MVDNWENVDGLGKPLNSVKEWNVDGSTSFRTIVCAIWDWVVPIYRTQFASAPRQTKAEKYERKGGELGGRTRIDAGYKAWWAWTFWLCRPFESRLGPVDRMGNSMKNLPWEEITDWQRADDDLARGRQWRSIILRSGVTRAGSVNCMRLLICKFQERMKISLGGVLGRRKGRCKKIRI